MQSPEHLRIVVEVAIAAGSVVAGGAVTYAVERWKQRREQRAKASRDAYSACLQLRKTLEGWMNEIADATREGQSSEEVLRRLLAEFEHKKFQEKIGDRFYDLKGEPLCEGLREKTNAFTLQAFESKGLIAMALVRGDFARDYPRHRNDAYRALERVYGDFKNELDRVIPLLQRKAQQ